MKILVENSTWNNIGDGFYQSALFVLIKQLYPDATVLMEEGPIYRAFRPKSEKQKQNALHLMNYQSADLHIFSGPMIRQILTNYKQKIIDLKNAGEQYALISASSAGISDELRKETGEFFQKYPPLFLSSRDEETYNKFKDYIKNSYNGICTAFLVNKMLPVDQLDEDFKFFISSFYRELEPVYKVNGDVKITNLELDRKKNFFGINHRFSRHLNRLRPQQDALNEHKIVRVQQEVSTKFNHITFAMPNSFVSFNLLSYLALYKSAAFTISDRVHSCAVSLAFGKPARLFTNSPRAGIFNRLGFDHRKNNGIMYPNMDIIDVEMEKMSSFIKSAF
ncbi:Polysaccharide pyruvyl transferase [Chitinophaga sp. CF118]|uniref:polysaccharide pyruvyl transferase family protein n=1 Tax=Chitinophaga sp. CF118 TaxID=1884367 RepID=UPI0008F1DF34|nr:polysaccharide pyruvyl transferase family protein [Chitinophaga sp. CF118]SFE03056.1 Polysaccharide pyruvyl transferase [Chitinophaga sp. CF118]